MTGHGASGSAAGYLYQCERALLELVRRSDDPSVRLLLEAADDIEIRSASQPSIALQVKHHVGSAQVLTDKSVDFWRTIGVWLDALDSIEAGEITILGLVSTQEVASNSGLALLGPATRDPSKARALLEVAARDSENQETSTARQRFLGLKETVRAPFQASIGQSYESGRYFNHRWLLRSPGDLAEVLGGTHATATPKVPMRRTALERNPDGSLLAA